MIYVTSFFSIPYLSNSEYWPLKLKKKHLNSWSSQTCFIGDRTEQQQLQRDYQIVATEPYLNQNRGQTSTLEVLSKIYLFHILG